MQAWKLGPAFAAGCTVVLKVSFLFSFVCYVIYLYLYFLIIELNSFFSRFEYYLMVCDLLCFVARRTNATHCASCW
jgi:hypothetical protein